MIEEILPSVVATAEMRNGDEAGDLFDEEKALIGRAVEKRRAEFASGRACARRALAELGFDPHPILSGKRGEPIWPGETIGSITHCNGYCASAVGRTRDLITIGIDAEPNQPLPERLLPDIARPEERPHLAELSRDQPSVHWDRLLFSAKESVYKAWFPLTRKWLGFEDATLTIHPEDAAFSAHLLVPGPVGARGTINGFEGRYLVRNGIVATAIAVAY
jgi:4'-phosphopantetheinyl transferase EntD